MGIGSMIFHVAYSLHLSPSDCHLFYSMNLMEHLTKRCLEIPSGSRYGKYLKELIESKLKNVLFMLGCITYLKGAVNS